MENCDDFIHTRNGWCYWTTNSHPMVYGLYVEPDCRQKGHATAILHIVINEIRRAGHDGEITIEAFPQEREIDRCTLVAFYQRLGLSVVTPDPCA